MAAAQGILAWAKVVLALEQRLHQKKNPDQLAHGLEKAIGKGITEGWFGVVSFSVMEFLVIADSIYFKAHHHHDSFIRL
jgi:hypothetical protein